MLSTHSLVAAAAISMFRWTMTTYVLIPGAGGAAWYWHRLVPELQQRGHEVVAVNLRPTTTQPAWRSTPTRTCSTPFSMTSQPMCHHWFEAGQLVWPV